MKVYFMNSYLQIQNGLSLGYLTGDTFNEQMAISSLTGNITTTGSISSNSLLTNTLTTSGTSLNIKSDIVRFRGLDNTVYIEADTGGVKFYEGVFYELISPNSKWLITRISDW